MTAAEWNAKVDAGWSAIVAAHTPSNDRELPAPLPAGMRPLLLELLRLGYPANAPQTRLHNEADAAIAWQVASMLDDYADATAFAAAA